MFGLFERHSDPPVEVGRFPIRQEPPWYEPIYADGDRLVDDDGEDWTLPIADALGIDPDHVADHLRRRA